MTVLLEASPRGLTCCTISAGHPSRVAVDLGFDGREHVKEMIAENTNVDMIAYLLLNGGNEVTAPVSLLTPGSLPAFERSIRLLPELNGMLYRIARSLLADFPLQTHVLLCDTAFFAELPAEASVYAIPYTLYAEGVRRFGSFGLCHQWAWKRARVATKRPIHTMISVSLGDRTNICAVRDGSPVDISSGFTPIEGIPSLRSCGDIDPTIVFLLLSTGMTFPEISRLLTMESGFSVLLGPECSFRSVLNDHTYPADTSAKRIYIYDVLKYIGGCIPLLGGLDALVFECEQVSETLPLIRDFCSQLRFLGVSCRNTPSENGPISDLTGDDSTAEVFCVRFDKWEILEDIARSFHT